MSSYSNYAGSFFAKTYRYSVPVKGSTDIIKTHIEQRNIIELYDENEYGPVFTRKVLNDKGEVEKFHFGTLRTITDCCGKVDTKYLEFVNLEDNGNLRLFINKKSKIGLITEYLYEYSESGYQTGNPEQAPTIRMGVLKRVVF